MVLDLPCPGEFVHEQGRCGGFHPLPHAPEGVGVQQRRGQRQASEMVNADLPDPHLAQARTLRGGQEGCKGFEAAQRGMPP